MAGGKRARAGAPWDHEEACWARGDLHVAGVDEVGRGPLAGPVVVAAVVLPPPGHPDHQDARRRLAEVTDSKRLSPAARERLALEIRELALAWAVTRSDPATIDRLNILRATQDAMARAVRAVRRRVKPDRLLVDGHLVIPGLRGAQEALVGGDARSVSIAAASILAKVDRDGLMVRLDDEFPAYGFARHMGYPTAEHREAIARHGLTPHHRLSFGPCKAVLG